jgi:transcriptional regulator with GAF, ATPase, and Fis domain
LSLSAEAVIAPGIDERFFCPDCPEGVGIVGQSPALTKVLALLRIISFSRCNPILIQGETGTGKESAAQAVHAWRCGPERKFVAVNCAALTASLLESELFGHVKGSFTGADRDKVGLFELAEDGCLFLDEISEMAPDLQAKLLRVLQERTFRRVGGTTDIVSRATVIASSNRDLAAEVRNNKFRKDLYYRLAVFPITLPPLRAADRRHDIPLLAEYFLAGGTCEPRSAVPKLSDEARERLLAHDWPGNVRELKNVIERALILDSSDVIGASSLLFDTSLSHIELGSASCTSAPTATARPREEFSLEAAEREFIIRALKEANWQRTRAAGLLGITRATLHAKLKRYDIQAPGGRQTSPSEVQS